MFDVNFAELGVIGVVALIVIGPEQLPRVARTAGHLMGRLRRYVSDVKSDISREMELADLQRLSDEVKDSARSIESSIREHVAGIESDVQQSITVPEVHHIGETPIAAAGSGEAEQAALALDASPMQVVPVDPNQIDMFGTPLVEPSESPEKH